MLKYLNKFDKKKFGSSSEGIIALTIQSIKAQIFFAKKMSTL